MRNLSQYKNPKKNILFLGYDESKTSIIKFLIDNKCNVDHTDKKIELKKGYDFVVSYGYRHILKLNNINQSNCPIFNLHISYLPYNKGAHPNFWSFYDNTPSGVTMHVVDEGVDTGPIIDQRYVNFEERHDTFMKTYKVLNLEMEDLFIHNFELLISGKWVATKQEGKGTCHLAKDLPINFSGWESNIKNEIKKLYKEGLKYG